MGASIFLIWFLGLVLAGLGILPAGEVPLGRGLVSEARSLRALSRPKPPSRADLIPARPARAAGAPKARPVAARARHAAGSARRTLRASAASQAITGSGSAGTASHGASSGGTVASTSERARRSVGSGAASGHGYRSAPGQTRSQYTLGHTKSSTFRSSGGASGRPTTSRGTGLALGHNLIKTRGSGNRT